MGFSGQEYWSGLPSPSLGDLPDPEIERRSPALQVESLPSYLPGKLPTSRYLFLDKDSTKLESVVNLVIKVTELDNVSYSSIGMGLFAEIKSFTFLTREEVWVPVPLPME